MKLKKRLELLAELGNFLKNEPSDPEVELAIRQAKFDNPWFTEDNSRQALRSIAEQFLDLKKLKNWAEKYPLADLEHPSKTVALVMAGNIPLVGFHDWLCVVAAGHRVKVKLSDKDKRLLPMLVKKLGDRDFEFWEYTEFVPEGQKLSGFDAVIATGSNNSARYFEQYFSKYPHLIRRNRNGVAVLDGSESVAEMLALGSDIFSYFGMGCRSVSKIYVPRGFNFDPLLEVLHEYNELILHDKWKNNFDYNMTLFILNRIKHLNNGCLILREEKTLAARIASVNFEFYDDLKILEGELGELREQIQCVVSKISFENLPMVKFGESQKPSLFDYPDGVDVMDFSHRINQPKKC